MNRRAALQALLALGVTPWSGPGRGAPSPANLIRINVPGPQLLPFIPVELIPVLGIDRELGVRLAIRHLPNGVQALEDLVAGDAHFAGTGFSVLPNFVAKGKPVVALATLSSGAPPYAVLVRNDLAADIRTLKDLTGRSLGIPLGSPTSKTYLQVIMELWLRAWGVASDQVRWVPAGMNLDGMHGALASGAVDAVFCEEPLAGTLVRRKIGTLLASLSDAKNPARFVGRQHFRAVLASTPALIAADPRRAELMARMLQRSLAWLHRTSPAAVVARLGFTDAQQARDIADALRRLPDLYSRDGRFAAAGIDSTRQFLNAAGIPLPAGLDVRDLIDERWVNAP